MLNSSTREIIMLGYEVSDEHIARLLAEASSRGALIYVIGDRGRGSLSRLLEKWPTGVPRPRVYQDRERSSSAPYASMHAKCLLVDGHDLLITSANFTFHGLHGNIEIGARFSGAPAQEARKIFSYLVESGLMILVE
jgi:phosphatidylserine/phosphatidylglycerophosphate/cardiolipin synthase-like enzyme